jgi:hypothetical protein
VARMIFHGQPSRRKVQLRYLLDGRLFRLLCDPGQAAALETFRASLVRLRLAAVGALPDFEMTPFGVFDAIGVKLPRIPTFDLPEGLTHVETGSHLIGWTRNELEQAPSLQAERLRSRVEELRQATGPEILDLFDLCLTRCVEREDFEGTLHLQLSFDYVFRRRYPERLRERMLKMLQGSLFDPGVKISGLTRMRVIKVMWDRSYEWLLKTREARGEIQEVDQEIRPIHFQDYLAWEAIHHAVLGYPAETTFHPVIAFTPDPEETLVARSRAYKTALRLFLDSFPPEERAGLLRPRMDAWKPGWLVSCREDGTLGEPISTGELRIL